MKSHVRSGISRDDIACDFDLRPSEVSGAIELTLNCEMPKSKEELFGLVIWAGVRGAFDGMPNWSPARVNSPDPITKFILCRHDVFNDALLAYRQRIVSGNPMPLGFVVHYMKTHLGRVVRECNCPSMARSLREGLRVTTATDAGLAAIVSGYRDQLVTLDLTQRIALDAVELGRSRPASGATGSWTGN